MATLRVLSDIACRHVAHGTARISNNGSGKTLMCLHSYAPGTLALLGKIGAADPQPRNVPKPADCCYMQKHMAHLEALYRLYERIVGYHGQLTAFFRQLREGAYIQATIESMLLVQSLWSPAGRMLSVALVALRR